MKGLVRLVVRGGADGGALNKRGVKGTCRKGPPPKAQAALKGFMRLVVRKGDAKVRRRSHNKL